MIAKRILITAFWLAPMLLLIGSRTAGAEVPAENAETTPEVTLEDSPTEQGGPAPEATEDPLTTAMATLVDRYYAATGIPVQAEEHRRGLDSVRYMLLDGVSLARIQAAVDEAIRLHSPGRRTPFEIAVPLRVRPAGTAPSAPAENDNEVSTAAQAPTAAQAGEPSATRATPDTQSQPPSSYDPATPAAAPPAPVDAEASSRRSERRKRAEARRQRTRLYDQWRQRTREQRMLLSIGVPLLAAGYGLSFFSASLAYMSGSVRADWAWVTAVPVVGGFLFTGWTQGDYPWHIGMSMMEVSGLALIITSIALKVDWPYERDPLAIRLGKRGRQGGSPSIVLRPEAWPGGLGIGGRF